MDQPINDAGVAVQSDAPVAAAAAAPMAAKPVAARRAKVARKPRAAKAIATAKPARAAKAPRAVKTATTRKVGRPAKIKTAATAAFAQASTPRLQKEITMQYDPTTWMKNFTNFGANLPGSDSLQAMFSEVGSRGQNALERSRSVAEEVTTMTRANVEALAETGRIAAAGVKSMSESLLERSRGGFEQAAAEVKTLTGAASPTEFFQRQSEIVRAQFDRAVADGSRFTETLVKLAGEAIQPLSNQASVNAEKLNTLAA